MLIDAYPVQHFLDEFFPLLVLPPLNEDIPFDTSMKEGKEKNKKDSYMEIISVAAPNPEGKGTKRTRSSQRLKAIPGRIEKKAKSNFFASTSMQAGKA